MTEDRIIALFMRKLAGEASNEELEELQFLLNTNPSFQYFEELFTCYWNTHENIIPEKDLSLDSHFNYILRTAQNQNIQDERLANFPILTSKKRTWLKICVAAAAIITAVIAVYIFQPKKPNKQLSSTDQKMVIVAKDGVRSKIILPDGTVVWLNSGSTLSYNNDAFNSSIRSVDLEGEAFFDVVKNAARPFIVHTTKLDIKVLGTVFNVKSYTDENTVEATLLRGLIEVERKDIPKAPKIILHDHEKMIFNEEDAKIIKYDSLKEHTKMAGDKKEISIIPISNFVPDSARVETSWIYNKLIFDGDTFTQLSLKMERWFNIKIYFLNTAIAAYRFSGTFENETIEEALQALQLTASFTYKIKGNEIYVDKK